jgi:hypothetical protein
MKSPIRMIRRAPALRTNAWYSKRNCPRKEAVAPMRINMVVKPVKNAVTLT